MLLTNILTFLAASASIAFAAPQNTQARIPSPAGLSATESDIATLCKAGAKTQWEQHVCQAFGNVQDGCMPQKRFAYGNQNSTNVKGIVLLFHGYTACPDAMEFLASTLQQQGYMTLTPLNVGHGRKYGDCSRPGAFCIQDTPIDQLPVRKEGYIDFTKWAVSMVREELAAIPTSVRSSDFKVSVTGLSLGAPLAATAVSLAGDLFSNAVLVDPFFSPSNTFVEFNILECQASSDPKGCIDKALNKYIQIDAKTDAGQPAEDGPVGVSRILKFLEDKAKGVVSMVADKVIGNLLLNRYPSLVRLESTLFSTIDANNFLNENLSFLNSSGGWGAGCFANTARPGYCAFQTKNLVAISSFGNYALSRVAQISGKTIAIITTERDGPIANGVSYAAASVFAAKNNAVSMCMFMRGQGCTNADMINGDLGNACGVPHSSFSHAEQTYTAPFELYWEKDLFGNILNVIQGASQTVGTPAYVDKSICTNVKIGALNAYKDKLYDVSDIVEDAIARFK
ncbi:hypothetical protein HDU97_007608 [Phlyctochytrium planicorne]|nr:hypothetical protein HDU97_007608 [Phlyctochytrium planicorne]